MSTVIALLRAYAASDALLILAVWCLLSLILGWCADRLLALCRAQRQREAQRALAAGLRRHRLAVAEWERELPKRSPAVCVALSAARGYVVGGRE